MVTAVIGKSVGPNALEIRRRMVVAGRVRWMVCRIVESGNCAVVAF